MPKTFVKEKMQMKRILALMLALLLLIGTLVACSDEEEQEESGVDLTVTSNDKIYAAGGDYNDQYKYEYINGDEVAITGLTASQTPHAITIPSVIDDRPVTAIADSALKHATNVTEITVPDSVVEIGSMAFAECTALTKVNLPATITKIGDAAFAECLNLSTVSIPAGVTELGKMAFYNCKSLTAIAIPAAITTIPQQSFMNCVKLKTVTWGDKVTAIEEFAFFGCSVLEGVTFPATVTTIGQYAFAECPKVAEPTLPGATFGNNAFYNAIPAQAETTHVYTSNTYVYSTVAGMVYRERVCDECGAKTDKTLLADAVMATDAASAQAALDNATDGTLIYLASAVDYGTLYLRTSTDDRAVNVGNWAGGYNMYYRAVKNVTILGSQGATLDAICIEAGTYTPEGNQHSGSADQPYLRSFIDIENLSVQDVTFTGDATTAIDLCGQIRVNGLTVKNCVMNDTGDSRLLYRQATVVTYTDLLTETELMTTSIKNVSIIDCEITGAYMVAELRGLENLTVTGNTFTNIADRVLLLATQDVHYTGEIVITDNTVNGAGERFLRAADVDANVTITGNTVSNYTGSDTDIVKVTELTGSYTISNNDWGNDTLTETVV